MSKINIRRIVETLKTKTTYLTPIVEAICNSIDAIDGEKDGLVTIKVKREPPSTTLEGTRVLGDILGIEICDNGIGFTNENRESFDTYRSDYKYKKGGKGFGRFTYLKYFNRVSITSIYCDKKDNDKIKERSFKFGTEDNIIIDEKVRELNEHTETGTILRLDSIIENSGIDKSIDVIARKLVERILVYFVNPESPAPKIILEEGDGTQSIVLNDYIGNNKDISLVGKRQISLTGKSNKCSSFQIQVYKIFYSPMISRVCLTAHGREVSENPLYNYIQEFKEQLFETKENYAPKNYIVKAYVIGEFLDENVSVERDSFAISKDDQNLFSEFTVAEIERAAADVVRDYFSNTVEERLSKKKEKVAHYVNSKAPWHKELLSELDINSMPMGISETELEMQLQRCKFEKEQRTLISLNELVKSQEENTDYDAIRSQVKELVNEISETGKNDLVHYVCNRKKILDLFDSLRSRREDGSPHLEEDIHNIIFPMRKNDQEIRYEDHNLWLIDERLVFSQYIASDKVISSKDTDEPDLAVFFNKRVALRNGENEIVSPISIYEFKRPRRTNYQDKDNPINQACRYARKLLEGKYEMPDGAEDIKVDQTHTPIYLYIIADIVPRIKDFADQANLTQTPDGEGYIGYMKAYNAYVQLMSFKKLVDDARMRNAIFFNKIGLTP